MASATCVSFDPLKHNTFQSDDDSHLYVQTPLQSDDESDEFFDCESESESESELEINSHTYDDIDSEDNIFDIADDETDSEDDELLAKYGEQVRNSQGFEVDKFPTLLRKLFGIINPIYNFQKDRGLLKKVKKCSKLAIHKYNTDNETNYGSVKVIKVNVEIVAGFIYYITFEAKNADDSETETFQAQVWARIVEEPKVELCRIKPSA